MDKFVFAVLAIISVILAPKVVMGSSSLGVRVEWCGPGFGSYYVKDLISENTYTFYSTSFRFDWQPIHWNGALGISTYFAYLAGKDLDPSSVEKPNLRDIWVYGGGIYYQYEYGEDPMFIPAISFDFEVLRVRHLIFGYRKIYSLGLPLTLFVPLNRYDKESSKTLKSSFGIERASLIANYRFMNSSGDAFFKQVGTQFRIGLRFEF